jgi:hypothetical protein
MQYLQTVGLLPQARQCVCGHHMNMQNTTRFADGKLWRCTYCKCTKSIRTGTFFAGLHLSLTQLTNPMFDWVSEVPVTMSAELVCKLAGVSATCARLVHVLVAQNRLGVICDSVDVGVAEMFD